MKIVILVYQIIQEKFAYGKLFMLVMIGYIFIIKMVKKMQNSGLEIVGGYTPLNSSHILLILKQKSCIHFELLEIIHFELLEIITIFNST